MVAGREVCKKAFFNTFSSFTYKNNLAFSTPVLVSLNNNGKPLPEFAGLMNCLERPRNQ
jgi:hypothetical protein